MEKCDPNDLKTDQREERTGNNIRRHRKAAQKESERVKKNKRERDFWKSCAVDLEDEESRSELPVEKTRKTSSSPTA